MAIEGRSWLALRCRNTGHLIAQTTGWRGRPAAGAAHGGAV